MQIVKCNVQKQAGRSFQKNICRKRQGKERMKIITLIENTSKAPRFHAEHGLSLYIETSNHRLLMDTGASGLAWENADTLGIDLAKVDTVVISHGHYDHAGGLLEFVKRNPRADIYMQKKALGKFYHGERYIGIAPEIANLPQLKLVEGEYSIDEELELFSNISGRILWPEGNQLLSELVDGIHRQDEFLHEQCLVVKEKETKVLISGCAHNGIINILDRYQELYQGYPDLVISGFHMMKKTDYTEAEKENIKATARKLKDLPTVFYTGHCTGEPAFALMKPIMGERLCSLGAGEMVWEG